MEITSGNRSRHTKHYYGNSKLEQLLLVFLGNQETTGAKKKKQLIDFSWIALLFLLSDLLRPLDFLLSSVSFLSFSRNSCFIENQTEAYKGSTVNEE